MADGAGRRRPAVDIELVAVGAVGAQLRRQNAPISLGPGRLLRLQNDCAGAVAEQHTRRPVGPVEKPREGLCADDKSAFGEAAANIGVGRRHRVDEAGTDRLHVECRTVPHAEAVLDVDCGCREGVVRSGGRDDDQVDVVRRQPGSLERRPRRRLAERALVSPSPAI